MGKDISLLYKANKKICKTFLSGEEIFKNQTRMYKNKQYEVYTVSHYDCIKAAVTISEGGHICKLDKTISLIGCLENHGFISSNFLRRTKIGFHPEGSGSPSVGLVEETASYW